MDQKYSQDHRLLQKMVLTPRMRHAIQTLGMSVNDLNDYIDTMVASNPFLEKLLAKQSSENFKKRQPASTATADPHDYRNEVTQDVDPREYLLSQIKTVILDEKELEIAEYLIYEMDENGYIRSEPEEVAENVFADAAEVRRILDIIQSMDPPGIGACDIRECLQLQLKRAGKKDSLEYTIVTDHISDLAINDIPKITKSLGVDKELVQQAMKNVKQLNPRPGSTLLGKGADWIVPDLIAKYAGKKVQLELNRESIPRLRLYNPYEQKLDIIKDPEARQFMKENMDAAKGLIDNIKRREETMCKVADYILSIQKDAFKDDSNHIHTLTIKDIAKVLDLHPSTISRTVSNKHIQINGEVVPLRFFLSHGLKKENGEITSKTNVKNRIKELVDKEDKAKPFSDQAIKGMLEQEGVFIKRRTVAKYRESLKILPTYLRRKKTSE